MSSSHSKDGVIAIAVDIVGRGLGTPSSHPMILTSILLVILIILVNDIFEDDED